MSPHELVEIWRANGDVDAHLVKALLNSNGIQCSLAGETLRLTHGFTLNKLGQVRVLVRAEDEDAARRLLADALEDAAQIPSED